MKKQKCRRFDKSCKKKMRKYTKSKNMKKEESRRRRSCKNLLKHKTYKKGPCTWGDDSIKNFPQKIKKNTDPVNVEFVIFPIFI